MSKERALVVEDNLLNQKFTKLLLEKEGYEVCVAEDGMQALGLIETFRPALILMDIQLPTVDGTELTQMIRSEPGNQELFIVALTGHSDDEWRRRALEAGCDAFLTKPVSIADLREALAQRGGERNKHREETLTAVDKVALMTRLGGDRDLLRELQETFVEECPRVNAELHRHLESRNSKALADAAHCMKGMLSTFSAIAATHAAQKLEQAAAAGNLEAAATALGEVSQQIDIFTKSLAELVEAA